MIEFGNWGNDTVARFSPEIVPEIAESLRDGRASGVSFAPWYGFTEQQFSLIELFRDARIVIVQDIPNFPVSALARFEALEEAAFGTLQNFIDLSLFPQLKRISCDWHNGLFKNTSDTLESLRLWKYSSKSGDLSAIPVLPSLQRLEITQSPIQSLQCIERYPRVSDLGLFYLPKLLSLAGVENVVLTKLTAENCGKLSRYDPIGACLQLREIKLYRCGTIPSLSFVKALKQLDSFRFIGTDVAGGDLSALKGIRDLIFTQKKHFSHRPEQLAGDYLVQ